MYYILIIYTKTKKKLVFIQLTIHVFNSFYSNLGKNYSIKVLASDPNNEVTISST